MALRADPPPRTRCVVAQAMQEGAAPRVLAPIAGAILRQAVAPRDGRLARAHLPVDRAVDVVPLLVEFLYELCGRYRLPGGRGGDAAELSPATTVVGIERFVDKARGVRGAAEVKRALRYACDNSLSPMETDIAETMVFDPRMGGFGLEKPQLNPRFEVARKNRRALPQSAYLPDLYWPRANISVEYDSDKHHRSDRKASEDAIRRNGIEHLGTRVVTLTWGQARNYYEFERVALLVASALGKKFGPGWNAWAPRRIELHRLLVQR